MVCVSKRAPNNDDMKVMWEKDGVPRTEVVRIIKRYVQETMWDYLLEDVQGRTGVVMGRARRGRRLAGALAEMCEYVVAGIEYVEGRYVADEDG